MNMNSLLSSRQAEELHKSMIAYLLTNNLPNTAAALRAESKLGKDVFDEPTAKKYETLLEKKWTSVVRLQKKIMDLESQNTALQSELNSATPSFLSQRNQDPATWLPRSPRYTLESHRDAINCIAFHPTFSSIASGSDDFTIKIWDSELGDLERTIKGHTRAVLSVDYGGPRGGIRLASCSSDLSIKLWDPADEYRNTHTLLGHDHSVSAVRFISSGDPIAPAYGNLLVSVSRDQVLMIWDVTTGHCVKTLQGHTGWIRDVCSSFDGRFLLSAGDDMTARLWDITSPTRKTTSTMVGHQHYNTCCAFAPPASYKHLALLAGLKKVPPQQSAAEFMATGSRDKTIKIWDAHGTCLTTLVGHDNWVRALVFHPGGQYLLSASDDKTLRCWDLSQGGKCVLTINDVHERFVTCLKWAPGIVKDAPVRDGSTANTKDQFKTQIRCVVATGGVDWKLRIFAS